MTTRLSDHFVLEEFAVSAAHPELVRPVPGIYVEHVIDLAQTVLEPIRRVLGRPMRVLSGYRSLALNTAVGGSKTSQHRRAEAADIQVTDERAVMRAMMVRPNPYQSGQVIGYPRQRFLHIALPSARYPTPSFFVCTAPKRYVRVFTAAEFDRLWPGDDATTKHAPTTSEGAE